MFSSFYCYLQERVPIFRKLTHLRVEGWGNSAIDKQFEALRNQADLTVEKLDKTYFYLMKRIAEEIHALTGAFEIGTSHGGRPRILDMCMAPGGFLEVAMKHNPRAQARAITLSTRDGGYAVRTTASPNITITFGDITMLAADMGVESIPSGHPDAENFLPREFHPEDIFDIAICDGQVLRTHVRNPWREPREATRLSLTQLVIALEHIRPGGTILFLLHKIESWKSVTLLRTVSKFARLQVYKPRASHRKRSSYYLVASDVQPAHEDAVRVVQEFKQLWKSATFDTEEEYRRVARSQEPDVEEVLADFGPALMKLGEQVWATQAEALEQALLKVRKSSANDFPVSLLTLWVVIYVYVNFALSTSPWIITIVS
ncbi:hypothetical protein GGR50DRAFT_689770 [Xylaria sp. CBS 124048]|nr:hypothetical protein GGR50DRAFT_689770 [Xylaria sp. CBS 124048]